MTLRWLILAAVMVAVLACLPLGASEPGGEASKNPYVVVLGIAQDGGYPQAGCRQRCCAPAWRDPARRRHVASLAIVEPGTQRRWLIDATPDFREQLRILDELAPSESSPALDGIFLTHAHVGHYTGLMQLGREVMGTNSVPVYAMPRMRRYLETSGPWDQLVKLKNIDIRPLEAGREVMLSGKLTVTPLPVPHRDEYSETVGYRIRGPARSVLYIPDIDKWEKWGTPLEKALASVDVAYVDGTFYAEGELPGRNMSEIPHPFIVETMARLAGLAEKERAKVRFLHLNHSNPALDPRGDARRRITRAGFSVADEGERQAL
ncbi:MAG TPA: MBL fold metallo-hydrolase [Candidatus Polarisedimenticolia bacterium]|nr:MBL fold metallo-hydrolase [Candidatus Polarisedimenticolia bacterium]